MYFKVNIHINNHSTLYKVNGVAKIVTGGTKHSCDFHPNGHQLEQKSHKASTQT
jgi:hypothetical protein